MTTGDQLARDGGVALWRQITERVSQDIRDGTHPPGARLPSEGELAAQFAVNRHTVRRALEELSRAGLVRVEQGRGSFVAEDVLDYDIGRRTRFSEVVRRHHREPSGRLLDLRESAADEAVAAALGVCPGAPVVVLERLGLADDRPVVIGTHTFPAERLPGLFSAFRETGGAITEGLARVGITDYRRQVTRVTARMPRPEEAALLRMAPNGPVLVTESVNVDRNGTVIEYGVGRYPASRVQIVFEP